MADPWLKQKLDKLRQNLDRWAKRTSVAGDDYVLLMNEYGFLLGVCKGQRERIEALEAELARLKSDADWDRNPDRMGDPDRMGG